MLVAQVNSLAYAFGKDDLPIEELMIKLNTRIFEKTKSSVFMSMIMLERDEENQRLYYC